MVEQGRLEYVVSPLGGLVRSVQRLHGHPGEPAYSVFSAVLGDLTQVLPNVRAATQGRSTYGEIDGAGSGTDPDTAITRAIAEAVERYASCVYASEQFIWATANELGDEALDLDTVPVCSAAELAHPMCPIRVPDKDAPIRWVRGVSLMTRRPVWIPAVMVYLHIPYLSIGERFTLPISTGCATHTTVEQALVNAICEVIERDAISLTWLQQLPLPQIEFDTIPEPLVPHLERYRNSDVKTYFFDATTDLGIPTVYSVDVSPRNPEVAALVMCATDLDPVRALTKVTREAASSRIAVQAPFHKRLDNPDLFIGVFHGAKYMGVPERLEAFNFLLQSPNRRRLSEIPVLDTGDPVRNLALLVRRLEEHGMEAFAVDLTTDEALRAGMRVVRVVIPQLQPLSFSYRARFLGHPRLYEAPRRMGYPVRSEAEINPWPQPFA